MSTERERMERSKRTGSNPGPIPKSQRSNEPGQPSAMAAIRSVEDSQPHEDVAHLGDKSALEAALQARQETLAEKLQQSIAALSQVLQEALPRGLQHPPQEPFQPGRRGQGPEMDDDRAGAFSHPPSPVPHVPREDDMDINRPQDERGEFFTPERIPKDLQRQLREAQKKLKRNMTIVLNCKDRIQKTNMELEKLTKGEIPNGNIPFKMAYICEEMDEKVGKSRKFEIQYTGEMTHKQRLEKLYQGYLHEKKSLEIELIKKTTRRDGKDVPFREVRAGNCWNRHIKRSKGAGRIGPNPGARYIEKLRKECKKDGSIEFQRPYSNFQRRKVEKA